MNSRLSGLLWPKGRPDKKKSYEYSFTFCIPHHDIKKICYTFSVKLALINKRLHKILEVKPLIKDPHWLDFAFIKMHISYQKFSFWWLLVSLCAKFRYTVRSTWPLPTFPIFNWTDSTERRIVGGRTAGSLIKYEKILVKECSVFNALFLHKFPRILLGIFLTFFFHI